MRIATGVLVGMLLMTGGTLHAESTDAVDAESPLVVLPSDAADGGNMRKEQKKERVTSALKKKAPVEDGEAQYQMGMACLRGIGRERDEAAAVRWLQAAAVRNHLGAEIQLGRMYRDGIGLKRNYIVALRFLKKAAEAGDSEAQIELGMMYYNGKGVYKDAVEAFVFLSLASSMIMTAVSPDVRAETINALSQLRTRLTVEERRNATERMAVEREKILLGMMRRHP